MHCIATPQKMQNNSNCAYIQCLDTPVGIKLSRVFKLKNITFKGSLQNYEKQSQFLKLHGCFSANLIQQQELGLESHYQMMQESNIIILFASEIGWTTQILDQIIQWQQNPQTKISRKVILINSSVNQKNSLLTKKVISMINRKLISGSVITHGLIYDSTFEFNNPLQTFINEIQQSKQLVLLPQLANQYLSFTSSAKIVLTIYRIIKGQITDKSYELMDLQLNFKDFNHLLEKMFLQQKPKPQAEAAAEPESDKKSPKRGSSSNKQQRPSQGSAPGDAAQQVVDDYCLANMIQFQVKQLTYSDMCKIVSLNTDQLSVQSASEISGCNTSQDSTFKSQSHLSQSICNKIGTLCNTSLLSNISLDCNLETIKKKAWDGSGQYCVQSALWIINESSKQKQEIPSVEFDLKQFNSFLNYQQSADETIMEIQKILQQQQLPQVIQVYTVNSDLIGAFLLSNLRKINICLSGAEAINQVHKKALMLQNNEFNIISFQNALFWLLQFGEAPKTAEFWRDVVPESTMEKMAIMTRLLHSKGFTENKGKIEASISEYFTQILTGQCEDFVDKGGKAPPKGAAPEEAEEAPPEQENSYIIAVKLLMLVYMQQLDVRKNCAVLGFNTPEAIQILETIKSTTLSEYVQNNGGDKFMQYVDPKKIPNQLQKGQLSYQNLIKDFNIKQYTIPNLNTILQAQKPGISYTHKLNPIINEIIINRQESRLYERMEIYDVYQIGATIVEQKFGRPAISVDKQSNQISVDFTFQFSLPVCSIFDVSAQVLSLKQLRQQLNNAYRLHNNLTFKQVDPKAKAPAGPVQSLEEEEVQKYEHSILQQQFFVERLKNRYLLTSDEVVSRAILFGLKQEVSKSNIVFLNQIMNIYGVVGLNSFIYQMFNIQLTLPSLESATISPAGTAASDKPSVTLSADESVHKSDQSVNQKEDGEEQETLEEKKEEKKEMDYRTNCYKAIFDMRSQYYQLFEQQKAAEIEAEKEAKRREKLAAAAYLDAQDAAENLEGDPEAKSAADDGKQSKLSQNPPGAPQAPAKTPVDAVTKGAPAGGVTPVPPGDDVPSFIKAIPPPTLSSELIQQLKLADSYFTQLDLPNILVNALSSLILGAQVGLVENQLEFLGEQLLEVRRQQKESEDLGHRVLE